jgi:hypothetical protein
MDNVVVGGGHAGLQAMTVCVGCDYQGLIHEVADSK